MIKDTIRKYRKEKKISQEEMAAELHVVRQTISKWETGKSEPSAEEILKIAAFLDVSVNQLLGIEENDSTEKLKQDITYLNEKLNEKIKQEKLLQKAENKRNLILFISVFTVLISLSIKNSVISLFLIVSCILVTLVILYQNIELLTKINRKDINIKALHKTIIFVIFIIALFFLIAFLSETKMIHMTENNEKFLAMCLVSGIMIFIGTISPKLPYQRYIGLRLPWTIRDEDTWNIAHRILGLISLPLALLYIACSIVMEDFDKVSLLTIAIWICIPGGISFFYYIKKMRGK